MGMTRQTHSPTRSARAECSKCGKRGLGQWQQTIGLTQYGMSPIRDRTCRYCRHTERQVRDIGGPWEARA